jgi:tRNA pseudouridine55 synthase
MDGLIIVDKPAGWTSHDVVARVRRILKEKRVGHTGTLDPFATGVLVLLVGRATRLAQFLAGAEKEYEATIRLGYSTATGDPTGERRDSTDGAEEVNGGADAADGTDGVARAPDCATLGREQVESALARLRGEIDQVPPMYSAKKVGGKKLYELARRGEEVERKAVRVRVEVFEINSDESGEFLKRNDDGTCDLRARVVCSAGTYVRALAESLGESLGTGAHLAALRRTRAGEFHVREAFVPDELQRLVEGGEGAGEFLTPIEAALPHLPTAHLTAEESRRARHGAAVRARDLPEGLSDGAHVVMFDERDALLAVGVYDAARASVQPRVMLAVEK